MVLEGASQVLCNFINPNIIKYKNEGLTRDEKKLLKDCIKALEALGFTDLYYNYNKRFKAIEDTKKTEYFVYKNNVLIKSFKTRREALDFYSDLKPFATKSDNLELIEKEYN